MGNRLARSVTVLTLVAAAIAATLGPGGPGAAAPPSGVASARRAPEPAAWSLQRVGGDDLLWYGPGAAADRMWVSRGDGTFASVNAAVSGTYRPVPGDYDRDGDTDILWYGPGAAPDRLWLSNGNGTFTNRTTTINGTYQPVPGDYDRDGDTDILWYGPGAAPDRLWLSNGNGTFTNRTTTINGTYQPVPGDYDRDGDTDILWYGPGAAPDRLWLSNGNGTFTNRTTTINGTYQPVPGDYDRDGDTDILWYGPGAAPDRLWLSNGNGTFTNRTTTINGTYQPVPGDYDRDGDTDILWYGPGAAPDRLWLSNGNGTFTNRTTTINGTYQPVPGDYNGSARRLRGAPVPALTDPEIRDLLLAIQPQPGTTMLSAAPAITGNAAADARIRTLAQARGYGRRSVATAGLTSSQGVPLQAAAANALSRLRADARQAGHTIQARSGFRSVSQQRSIFLRELAERGSFGAGQIAAGAADWAILDVLRLHSIPGYSRHHSGYAVDLADAGGSLIRAGASAEVWLRSGRFSRPIAVGFLPSYPPGGGRQGPDPEAWEYTYVGRGTILCAGWFLDLGDPSARWSCAP